MSTAMAMYSVPAGNYMIWGELELTDPSSTSNIGTCVIRVSRSDVPGARDETYLPGTAAGVGNVSIATATTLTGGGSVVEIDCDSNDNTVSALNANLSLIPTDVLN